VLVKTALNPYEKAAKITSKQLKLPGFLAHAIIKRPALIILMKAAILISGSYLTAVIQRPKDPQAFKKACLTHHTLEFIGRTTMQDLREQRIWLTGGTGFLGRAVVAEFKAQGFENVLVTSRKDCDVRDVQQIRRFLADQRPQAVVHMAAVVGGIGANREHPAEFFYDNMMMGTQLMHESWQSGVEKFVTLGTVCAYPKIVPIPFKEENLWDGYPEETNAPYGLAKKMLLVQGQAYRQQYGFNAVYLLPVNLYGPWDNFDPASSHVIPALLRKCLEAVENGREVVEVWGDGSPTREFLYVEDAARGIVAALRYYNEPEPVNLGSGMEISMRDLIELIASLTGFKGRIEWDTTRPNGQPRRCLDTSRAEQGFGFKATTDFRQGLARTIEWYKTQVL
jgi:GDP-L-fucose synthase